MSSQLLLGLLVALAQGLNVWITSRIRAEMAELKLAITEKRMADKTEMRDWVDEEFMRRTEIEAKLEALKAAR